MKDPDSAKIQGRVLDPEGKDLGQGYELGLVRARDGEVITPALSIVGEGEFFIEGLPPDETYFVKVNGAPGVPAAIQPEAGNSTQNFIACATLDTAIVDITVKAYNGDSLPGKQVVRFRDVDSGQWEPEQDTDLQDGEQKLVYPLVAYRTYEVWINRGPGIPDDIYAPPGHTYYTYTRNSGTAYVLLTPSASDDRMRWFLKGGAAKTYIFNPSGGRKMVSLPAGVEYDVKVRTEPPPPDFANCPETPWEMPSIPGTGSQNLDLTRPY